jgi:ABC-2 type transport system permease protein
MSDAMWINFKHSIIRSRWQIIGWGLILGFYGAYMVSFYDNLLGMQDQFMELIANYPPELLAAVGVTSPEELFSVAGYLNTYVFSYMPLIVGVLAVMAGSGLLAADEEDGVLDLVMGHPVSRGRLFAGRLLAFVATQASVAMLLWAGLAIGTLTVDLGLSAIDFVWPSLSLLAALLFFGTFAVMASMLLPSRKIAAMAAGGLLAVSFLLTMFGNLDPTLASIADFSPLSYYQGGKAIAGIEWTWLAALFGISIVFAIIALWRFQKREIRVAGERGVAFPRLRLRRQDAVRQA